MGTHYPLNSPIASAKSGSRDYSYAAQRGVYIALLHQAESEAPAICRSFDRIIPDLVALRNPDVRVPRVACVRAVHPVVATVCIYRFASAFVCVYTCGTITVCERERERESGCMGELLAGFMCVYIHTPRRSRRAQILAPT